MKRKVERTPLTTGESYLNRLVTACNGITTANCLNYIRHSKSFQNPFGQKHYDERIYK